MKIKYIISTHKDYYLTTLPKITDSLINNNIKYEDIYITIGGCIENKNSNFGIIETNEVIHNSFDLTSLIEVEKRGLFNDYDYIFLLHDTCFLERNFKEKIESYINEKTVTIGLWKQHQSSNIGLYKRSYLNEIGDHIYSYINKSKLEYVEMEDYWLRNHPYEKQFFGEKPNIIGYEKIYNDETIREINVCEEIELYKYKANWYVRDWVNKP